MNGAAGSPAAWLLRGFVRGYQYLVAPLIGPHCRFYPSCSHYALDALAAHGALRGSWLTLRRLLRCHPFGGSGYDPVPAATKSGNSSSRPSLRVHGPACRAGRRPFRDAS